MSFLFELITTCTTCLILLEEVNFWDTLLRIDRDIFRAHFSGFLALLDRPLSFVEVAEAVKCVLEGLMGL